MDIKPIAHIHNDFRSKFGLPRQSGMAEHLISEIVMEKEYRMPDAFRGITEFSHLWLIWEFAPFGDHRSGETHISATVRPPKLGGNERVGVFATRSPNRPNRLGMTAVKLISLEETEDRGTVLKVSGADIMDGTAIFDIKPYIPFADRVTDASAGIFDNLSDDKKTVVMRCSVPEELKGDRLLALNEVLRLDPRPGYQDDPERIYGFVYGEYTVRFRVTGTELYVIEIVKETANG